MGTLFYSKSKGENMLKQNKFLCKIISFICILSQLFILIGIPSFASENYDVTDSNDEISINDSLGNTAETLSSPDGNLEPEITYSITDPINPILPTTSNCICTVSTELWLSVLSNSTGSEIYATVYGYRSGEFDSGPYVSTFINIWNDDSNHIIIKQFNDEMHWQECRCGLEITEKAPHSITYSYYTPTQHYTKCTACNLLRHDDHVYNILYSTSDTSHTYKCVCGVSSTSAHSRMVALKVGSSEYHRATCYCGTAFDEPHTASRYTTKNNLYHNIICDCGQVIGQSNHDWQKSGTKNICRQCGQVSSALDGPILWKIEEDEEKQ